MPPALLSPRQRQTAPAPAGKRLRAGLTRLDGHYRPGRWQAFYRADASERRAVPDTLAASRPADRLLQEYAA